NTSNEGFLANKFAKDTSRDELLKNPLDVAADVRRLQSATESSPQPSFCNEPHTDFTVPREREKIATALQRLRKNLRQRHPLIINNKPVSTNDWLPSRNPANQNEIIGQAAQATIAEADAALAAARSAQAKWAATPADERAAILEKVAALMRRDKADLCAVEIL